MDFEFEIFLFLGILDFGFFVLKVGNSSFYQTDTLVVSSFAYCRNGANAYVFGFGVSIGLDICHEVGVRWVIEVMGSSFMVRGL